MSESGQRSANALMAESEGQNAERRFGSQGQTSLPAGRQTSLTENKPKAACAQRLANTPLLLQHFRSGQKCCNIMAQDQTSNHKIFCVRLILPDLCLDLDGVDGHPMTPVAES